MKKSLKTHNDISTKSNATFRYALLHSFICLLFVSLFPKTGMTNADTGQPQKLPQRCTETKLQRLDPAFLISPDYVLGRWKKNKKEMILIDVRPPEKFVKIRIDGAMNMPLFAIHTKKFLKGRRIVLINEGYQCINLINECRHLKEQGFLEVRVMFGGLWYWHQRGGTLAGNVFTISDLNLVSAHDFFVQKNLENQVVIDISKQPSQDVRNLMPGTVSVPFSCEGDKFLKAIKRHCRAIDKQRYAVVVLFNRNGRYHRKIYDLMRKAGILNFYLLEGGLEGYRDFIAQQAVINKKKNEKKVIKKCPTCP